MTDFPRAGTGRTLAGRYRLDRHLASGGMAEVWEATDEVLDRPVAAKLLHGHLADDPALRARFHHEAVAAARLVHPAIVAIYDTCDEPGAEAIVMELVRGRTLRQFLDERGRLEPVEVVHIGAEVASALSCAHRAGIVHRDIKPANILLSDDGRVLVTDFGIAKVLDEPDLTRTSQLLGTVKYLAPEQVESGPVDARTDVYALGAVLYEALCGQAPFRADNQAALALARLQRDPQPPHDVVAGVPPMLEDAVMRALARLPQDRFATAEDLRTALLGTRIDQWGDQTVVTGAHGLTAVAAAGTGTGATAFGRGPGTPGDTPGWGTPVTAAAPRRRRVGPAVVISLVVVVALVLVRAAGRHHRRGSEALLERSAVLEDRPDRPTPADRRSPLLRPRGRGRRRRERAADRRRHRRPARDRLAHRDLRDPLVRQPEGRCGPRDRPGDARPTSTSSPSPRPPPGGP